MSAPQTNLDTQERRHSGPITGIRAGLVFAGVLLVALIVWTVYNGDAPRDATTIDGRTGAVEQSG